MPAAAAAHCGWRAYVYCAPQVDTLTAEVASLKEQRAPQPSGATAGMQEQLNQMALSMDKRHTRVETAIYQARTVC